MSRFAMANRIAARSGQARIDNAMPDEQDDHASDPCECGANEWSLWQRGDSEQGPIYQCCMCGAKEER